MQLLEKLRRAGIKPLLRDATMEEHAALVSYTEFESWWSAIYEGRRQLKAFETPHEHNDVRLKSILIAHPFALKINFIFRMSYLKF